MRHGPQITCECCGRQFPKQSKRPQQFCSEACRKKQGRWKAAGHPEVQSSVASVYAPKNAKGSVCCTAKNGHPYPPRTNLPIDVLGGAYRPTKRPKLDRDTWSRILWSEIGRPLNCNGEI
jgi:hypothetical protein